MFIDEFLFPATIRRIAREGEAQRSQKSKAFVQKGGGLRDGVRNNRSLPLRQPRARTKP